MPNLTSQQMFRQSLLKYQKIEYQAYSGGGLCAVNRFFALDDPKLVDWVICIEIVSGKVVFEEQHGVESNS